jgi:hypothetical protein
MQMPYVYVNCCLETNCFLSNMMLGFAPYRGSTHVDIVNGTPSIFTFFLPYEVP